ncbi:MAG: Holliday junction branch migration protein RuvA [Kiritimatiellaeota bacterium]|nr:Holliday junction branch migration protein RuvA [Kiritimatiellota bacterium]
MIAFLQGKLEAKSPTVAVMDVQGVGYEVFIPLSTYDRLPASGEPCRLLIHHHIREDAQMLFGFAQADEKAMFERLITISGVGPKTALSILGGLTVSELSAAIAGNDIKRVSTIRGIGKKTAERLIVELRDKVSPLEALAARAAGGGDPHAAMLRDAVLALTQLGFPQEQARKMAQVALDADPSIGDAETLLRKSLSSK